MSPFYGCWERIHRASFHNKACGNEWNRFIEEHPYSTFASVDDDGAGRITVECRYDPFPERFSLMIGEFLYQLRATLDACIYQAAILDSGQDPPPKYDDLEFPIRSTPDKFKAARWKLGPLEDDSRRIVELIQPYNAPILANDQIVYNFNRTIGIINDWARLDRHRGLRVVGSWAGQASPQLVLPAGVSIASMQCDDGFLNGETVVAEFQLDGWKPGMRINANPDLIIDIAVNETPYPIAPNDCLGLRMEAMLKTVSWVVSSMETRFGC